jgi:hypothetical protein
MQYCSALIEAVSKSLMMTAMAMRGFVSTRAGILDGATAA